MIKNLVEKATLIFIYDEVYKLHMVTIYIKSIDLVYVIHIPQTSGIDEI